MQIAGRTKERGPGPPRGRRWVWGRRARRGAGARGAGRRRETCGRAGPARRESTSVRARPCGAVERWPGRSWPGLAALEPARPRAREAAGRGERFWRGPPRRAHPHTHTPPRGSAGSAAARGGRAAAAGAEGAPLPGARPVPPRGLRSSPPRGRRRGAGAEARAGWDPARTWRVLLGWFCCGWDVFGFFLFRPAGRRGGGATSPIGISAVYLWPSRVRSGAG